MIIIEIINCFQAAQKLHNELQESPPLPQPQKKIKTQEQKWETDKHMQAFCKSAFPSKKNLEKTYKMPETTAQEAPTTGFKDLIVIS